MKAAIAVFIAIASARRSSENKSVAGTLGSDGPRVGVVDQDYIAKFQDLHNKTDADLERAESPTVTVVSDEGDKQQWEIIKRKGGGGSKDCYHATTESGVSMALFFPNRTDGARLYRVWKDIMKDEIAVGDFMKNLGVRTVEYRKITLLHQDTKIETLAATWFDSKFVYESKENPSSRLIRGIRDGKIALGIDDTEVNETDKVKHFLRYVLQDCRKIALSGYWFAKEIDSIHWILIKDEDDNKYYPHILVFDFSPKERVGYQQSAIDDRPKRSSKSKSNYYNVIIRDQIMNLWNLFSKLEKYEAKVQDPTDWKKKNSSSLSKDAEEFAEDAEEKTHHFREQDQNKRHMPLHLVLQA